MKETPGYSPDCSEEPEIFYRGQRLTRGELVSQLQQVARLGVTGCRWANPDEQIDPFGRRLKDQAEDWLKDEKDDLEGRLIR